MARLVVESGVDGGMIFPLSVPLVSVGRSISNSIQIIDRKISRRHAEVSLRDGKYFFHDLDSKNGSFINENPITKDTLLKNGDRIKVGETTLIYESGPEDSSLVTDTTSRSVKIIEDLDWGTTRGTIAAGSQPSLELKVTPPKPESLKDSHKRLAILYQVADAIRNILDLDELLEQIMNIIYNVIQPDRGFIMLRDEHTHELIPRTIKKRSPDEEEITISSTIVDQCLRDRISILVSDAATDRRFSASESVILNKIRSAICSPLIYKDEILGVIYVDTQSRIVSYSKGELELLTGIANQAAMAIANAKLHTRLVEQHKLEKEMEIARTIQMNLLPKVYPALDGFDISAMSLPAKKVGGDYYDFIQLAEGRYAIAIADVSGKGVPAALLLATIRATLQIVAQQKDAIVTSVVSKMNQMTCRDATNDMFVTIVYGILDPAKKIFQYTNAGHSYPLLFDYGKVRRLQTGGCFLGIMENVEYKAQTIRLKSGQTLVLYTDGVTDTMNASGEIFGLERLKVAIRSKLQCPAQEIRDFIYQTCLDFRSGTEPFDDFTLVILKVE